MNPAAAHAPSLGGTLLSFALVLGLIFALAWVMKRVRGRSVRRGGELRIRASLALGAKERLVLVEAAGEHLLLGVGAAGVRRLHRYAAPLPEAAPEEYGFATLLQRLHPAGGRADAR